MHPHPSRPELIRLVTTAIIAAAAFPAGALAIQAITGGLEPLGLIAAGCTTATLSMLVAMHATGAETPGSTVSRTLGVGILCALTNSGATYLVLGLLRELPSNIGGAHGPELFAGAIFASLIGAFFAAPIGLLFSTLFLPLTLAAHRHIREPSCEGFDALFGFGGLWLASTSTATLIAGASFEHGTALDFSFVAPATFAVAGAILAVIGYARRSWRRRWLKQILLEQNEEYRIVAISKFEAAQTADLPRLFHERTFPDAVLCRLERSGVAPYRDATNLLPIALLEG